MICRIIDTQSVKIRRTMGDGINIARRRLRHAGYNGDLDAMRNTTGPAISPKARATRSAVHAGTFFNGHACIREDGSIEFDSTMFLDDIVAVLAAIAKRWPDAMYAGAPAERTAAVNALCDFLVEMDEAALRKGTLGEDELALEWPKPFDHDGH